MCVLCPFGLVLEASLQAERSELVASMQASQEAAAQQLANKVRRSLLEAR